MILDCFTFFNELDLLEGRLEYLYDTVDYFIIVETNITHSGIPKPLNYLQNARRYQKYSDKILYFPFAADVNQYDFTQKPTAFDHNAPQWKIENFQRNYISEALKLFPDDAITIISDLDEIASKEAIELAKHAIGPMGQALSFQQKMFYYNFDRCASYPWMASVVSTNKFVREQTPQYLRLCASEWKNLNFIYDGGWHFSFWGGAEKVSEKIKSFAHQEHNLDKFTDLNLIEQRISSGIDPFDRGEMIPTDLSDIPNEILEIFGKYSKGNVNVSDTGS